MRRFGKWLGRVLLFILLCLVGLWVFGPREPVDTQIGFEPSELPGDLDAYLAKQEAAFDDITPGAEKQIIWAGAPGVQTKRAIVYLHGYSATAEEIRPVPDQLAEQLGANLYFARLTGHGRGGEALADAEAGDWLEDVAEALAIGRALGEEVIVLATSTGGTAVAVMAAQPQGMEQVAGIAFISPNFGIQNPAAALLTFPFAREILPPIVGAERSFEPINSAHGRYWTTKYPTVAVLPMAALVKHARGLDFEAARMPALFLMSREDKVVSPDATREIVARWGGDARIEWREMGPGDDPYHHVLAGDILSPGQNAETLEILLNWVGSL